MCVWQSQAPAGTSKFTGVAGWDALAWLVRACRIAPVASAPTRMARRVSMGCLLFVISIEVSVSTRASPGSPGAAQGMSHHRAVEHRDGRHYTARTTADLGSSLLGQAPHVLSWRSSGNIAGIAVVCSTWTYCLEEECCTCLNARRG